MTSFSIITSEGKIIDLVGGNPTTELQSNNNTFQFDALDGAIVHELEFPLEGNEEAFGQDHIISTLGSVKVYKAVLKEYGNALEEGIITKYDSTTDGYNAVIRCDFIVNDFAFKALDLTLQDVCERIIDLRPNGLQTIEDAAGFYAGQAWPNTPVAFPTHRNDEFYGSFYDQHTGIINPYDSIAQTYRPMSGLNTDGPADVFDTKFTYVAFPYVMEVFDGISKYFGYTLKGTFFTSKKARQALVEGGLALDNAPQLDLFSVSQNTLGFVIYTNNAGVSGAWPYNVINPENQYLDITISADKPFNINDAIERKLRLTVTHNVTLENPFLGNNSASVEFDVEISGATGVIGTFTENFSTNDDDAVNPSGVSGIRQINRTVTYELSFTTIAADNTEALGINFNVTTLEGDDSTYSATSKLVISRDLDATLNNGLEEFRLGDTLPPEPVTGYIRKCKNLFGTTLEFNNLERSITMNFTDTLGLDEPVDIPATATAKNYRKLPPQLVKQTLTHGTEASEEPSLYIGEFNRFTDLPAAALHSTALVLNEQAYYKYAYNPDIEDENMVVVGGQEWQRFSVRTDNYTIGEDGEEQSISTEITLPEMVNTVLSTDGGGEGLIPQYSHQGASRIYGMPSLPDHTLSVLWYARNQPGSAGEYWMATTTELNYIGELYNGVKTKSMFWQGDYGLYFWFWQRLAKILETAEDVEISLLLEQQLKRTSSLNQTLRVANQRMIRVDQTAILGIEEFSRVKLKKL